MTVVAGFRDATGKVGIICDSAFTSTYQFTSENGKMFESGGLVWAIAGILPPVFRAKKYPGTVAGVHSLAKDLYVACRKVDHGIVDENGVFALPVSMVVVGLGLVPYVVGPEGAPIPASDGYVAVGSGADVAMGAMHAAKSLEAGVEAALDLAFQAAVTHDPFCNGPGCMRILDPPVAPARRKRAK